jgi:hypothetical protein
MDSVLHFPAKKIRAEYIADYIRAAGYHGAVVFGCGNGAQALRDCGITVIDISPRGELVPTRWWQPEEIARVWPNYFDATSGHLPAWMMIEIGKKFREHIGDDLSECYVPSGSGETIVCLRWAYPGIKLSPIYNLDEATQYSENSPLNFLVSQGAD